MTEKSNKYAQVPPSKANPTQQTALIKPGDIPATRDELRKMIEVVLANLPDRSGGFPPCADVLLATINTTKSENQIDAVTQMFLEYFRFDEREVIARNSPILEQLDSALKDCGGGWPPECCVPAGCVSLCGVRHLRARSQQNGAGTTGCLRQIRIADAAWLYYAELMGLFSIGGAILDDYATRGRFPIDSNTLEGIIIETMISQIKSGESSSMRDRYGMYLRTLDWKMGSTDKLDLKTNPNSAFNTQLFALLGLMSEYYHYNRLQGAIQATTTATRPSIATITAIRDTIGLLRKSFDAFYYGRNYTNTLAGIVWVIAIHGLVRNLRRHLGIPESFNQPHQYIPAAYELLVAGKPGTPSVTNRYTLHMDAARYSRRILLDLDALPLEDAELPALEAWLALVEDQVEGYRAAYRGITGIDIGVSADRRV